MVEEIYASAIAEIGVSLTTLALKGTATTINAKIKAIKDEKNAEKIRNTYDEIINELLSEREEAIRIAQTYKAELDRIVISDEDIEHLHKTVSRILEIVKVFQLASALGKGDEEIQKINTQVDSYEQIKELISVDTLKTMQLLGFNYKSAIGEPLTNICAKAISTLGSRSENPINKNTGKNVNKKY